MPSDFSNLVQQAGFGNQGGGAPQGGGGGGYQGGGWQGGGVTDWRQFAQQYQQLQQANNQINLNNPYQQQGNPYLQQNNQWSQNDYNLNRDRGFRLDGGTEDMYNGRYRDANAADTAAIMAGRGGEFLMNLPGEIAGALGGEQAKQDWTFDASKFDLTNGLDMGDLTQVRNFAASLPGMIPGGLLEGAEKGYEAITGAPVQEYREKQGGGYEIADYTLDASQRAAAGIDAAIDIGGTFTGGAGRVVGTVGKAAAKRAFKEAGETGAKEAFEKGVNVMSKAQRTQQRLENMSKGMIDRAWEGVGGKMPTGAIGQTAFDIGNEASEEFVQSYADDIRNKNLDEGSLDRALTGAAWGAFGGGLMSVGSRIANGRLIDSGKNSSPDAPLEDTHEPYTFNQAYDAVRKLNIDANMMDAKGAQIIGDRLQNDRSAPGSAIFKHTGSDASMNIDDIELGTENLQHIWFNGDRDKQKLAYAFGTDVDTLDAIFNPPVGKEVDIAAALSGLADEKQGDVEIVIGRNPDTKNGGFKVNLRRIVNGQSFKLHPLAYAITGSDIDGDTSSVYFDNDQAAPGDNSKDLSLNVLGYASQMLLDPEGGTNVDWWYAGFDKHVKANRNKIDQIISNSLQGYTRQFEYNGKQMSAAEYFKQRISDAIDTKDKDQRNVELSRVFSDLGSIVDDMNSGNEFISRSQIDTGRNVVNSVLNQITNDEQALLNDYIEYNAAQIAANMATISGIEPAEQDEYKSAFSDWVRHGTIGENTKAFQLNQVLGLITHYVGAKNPLYRQYGMLRYLSASKPVFNDIVTSLGNVYSSESVIKELLRASFRMAQVGESPSDSIEGVIDTLFLAELYNSSSLGTGKVDLNEVQQKLHEIQNKYSRIYNESKKVLTQNGYEEDPKSPYKNSLPEPKDGFFSNEYMRVFNRVFANAQLSDVVDVSKLPSRYAEMTWRQFLDSVTGNAFSENIDILIANFGENTSTAKFLRAAINEVGSVNTAIESSIREAFSGINTKNILARYEQNGNKIDPKDIPAVLSIMEAVHEVVDDNVSIYLRLFDPNALLQTKLGMMLFSGDVNSVLNVLTSASIYTEFNPIIEDLESGDSERIASAKKDLAKISIKSPTHSILAAQIAEGDYSLFQQLVDLDYRFDRKLSDWKSVIGDVFTTSNYVVDTLNIQGGSFGKSSISKSVKKAASAVTRYKRLCYDEMVKEVDFFEKKVSILGDNDQLVDDFITSTAEDAIVIPSMDLLWMKVYSSVTLDNKYVEKATNTDAALQMFLANQLSMNGNLVSHVDSITAHEHGVISSDDWLGNRYHVLKCMTDPDYRQWVVDSDTGSRYLMTRERLFRSAGVELDGDRPKARQYIQLMKEYPQLAGYLCETRMNMTSSDSQVGVAPGRLQNLSDAFDDWQSGIRGTKKEGQDPKLDIADQASMDRAIKIVRARLFNDPKAHKIVTWLLNDDTLSGSIDMKKGVRDVQSKYNALVRHVYYRASKMPIGGESRNLRSSAEVVAFKRNHLQRMMTQLYTLVQTAYKQMMYDADIDDTMLRNLMSYAMDTTQIMQLQRLYPDYDISTAISNPFGDNIGDTLDALKSNYKQMIDATLTVMYTMAEGDLGVLSELSMYSGNADVVRGAIRSAVRAKDPALSEEEVENKVDEMYNSSKSTSVERIKKLFPGLSSTMLVDSDFVAGHVGKVGLEDKLTQLYHFDPELLKKVKGDVESVYDDNGNIKPDAKRRLIDTANGNLVSHSLRQIAQLNMMPVNENALQAYHDAMTTIDQLVDECATELRDKGIFPSDHQIVEDWFTDNNYTADLPHMDFLSRTKQSSVSQQAIMDMAGGSPARVGYNGALGKKVSSLGHLPRDISGTGKDYATEITVGQIKGQTGPLQYGWKAVNEDDDVIPVGSPEFMAWISALPDDQVIQLYDPENNPHGLPTHNTSYRVYDPDSKYHRITGIIGRIIDYSQEQMVLKAKKTFRSVDKIVTGREIKNAGDYTVSISQDATIDEMYDTYRDVFMSARKNYELGLKREFMPGGSMDGLGFNNDQALLLSQFLTPGMIVTYTIDGKTSCMVLDADVFFGQDSMDKFFAALDPIIQAGGVIESSEVMYVTLEEASQKVGKAVAFAESDKGGDLTKAEAEAAAVKAMGDWSDYRIDYDEDISNLVSKLSPIGHAYRGQIVAPDSPTGFQQLLNEVFDGGGASEVNTVKPHVPTDVESQQMTEIGKMLRVVNGEGSPYKVARIWRPNSANVFSGDSERQALYRAANVMTPGDGEFAGIGVVGVCMDKDSVRDALAWGARTNHAVFIDESLINDALIPDKRMLSSETVMLNKGNNGSSGVKFRRIEAWKQFNYVVDSASDVTSAAEDADISNIFTVGMVEAGMVKERPGDAEIKYMPNMDHVTLPNNGSSKKRPVEEYFPIDNNHPKRIVNRNDAKKMLDVVAKKDGDGYYIPASDDKIWLDAGFVLETDAVRTSKVKKEDLKRRIVEYLVDINTNDRMVTDPRPSVAKRSNVACFITDGTVISPVLYPDNMPHNVTYAETAVVNGDVVTYFSGTTPLTIDGVASSTKYRLEAETFKGMMARWTKRFIPKLGNGRELNALASGDTEGSRVDGMGEQLLKNALYYELMLRHGSLFYNGTDFNDYIKNNWTEEDKIQFASSALSSDFMKRVINMQLRFTDDPDTNRIIANVFRACRKYKVNPIHLLSSYRLEMDADGKLHRVATGRDQSNMNSFKKVDFQLVYANFDSDQMLKLYHAADPTLCKNGTMDTRDRTEYLIDERGLCCVQLDQNGGYDEIPVRYGFHNVLEESTEERTPSGESSISRQHQYRRAMDRGYLDSEITDALDHESFVFGNYNRALDVANEIRDRKRHTELSINEEYLPQSAKEAIKYNYATYREIRRIARDRTCVANTMREDRKVIDASTGEEVENINDHVNMVDAMQRFNDAMNLDRNPNERNKVFGYDFINRLEMFNSGSSYIDGADDWSVGENNWARSVEDMAQGLSDPVRPMPCRMNAKNTSKLGDRYPLPMMTPEFVDLIWENSPHVRKCWVTKDKFIDGLREEQDKAERAIGSINEKNRNLKNKKSALGSFARSVRYSWGETSKALQPCYEDYTMQAIANDNNRIAQALASGEKWTKEQLDLYKERCRESDEKLSELRDYLTNLGYNEVEVNGVMGNITGYSTADDAKVLSNILNNAAELSKALAILNPLVTVANITDRTLHQGMMNASIHLCHKLKMGPYYSSNWTNQDIVKRAVNDPLAIRLYASFRAAEFNNEEMAFLATAVQTKNLSAIDQWLQERRSKMTPFQKAVDWSYKIGSGGNFRIKGQMRNFINQFVIFAEEDGQTFWFEPEGSQTIEEDGKKRPLTFLEAKLNSESGFAEFFLECIGAKGKTPSYSIAMKAMNAAKAADMAQRSAPSVILADICRRVPFGKFLMTTCVSRFPAYGINVTGRMLNWIMPISSINYVFTEYMAQTEYGQKLGLEETQRYASLRQAIQVDMCKLGIGGVAMVLFALSGMLQPPDDEKKWGEIDEWMVMGRRAGESWWIEDILGMALPLACFWKSAEQGKPRLDILTNGMANACYSNPILRCSDVASFLINPGESLISDYNEEVQQFQNAKGGPPSFDQYLQSNVFSLGMSWLSQFATPSIVREWYQSSTTFEKSYKKVYETGPTGVLTEEGALGKTVYTTYDEAIKRKLARRNPVLAALFSFTNGTGTSYWAADMPDTVYYDDYQLDSSQALSVSGLSDSERMAKVIDIIGIMQSYDDMNELAAEGFHLDYETLTAVAQQVWDNYHAVDEWYYGLQADGKLDYYTLGNGDYAAGMALAGELKQERDTQKQYWYDFYYQKLKNSPIAGKLQTYNRYNTSYARDVYGEVYATGVRKSPFNFLPFTGAPGSLENMEGTAGYENDWATVSAVTGLPMDQRALIPNTDGNIDMPDFEYWSGDGEGNTYSKQYQNIYGTVGNTSGSTSSGYSRSSGGSGYTRRSYGGGGGGYRRYSRGGGGGYSRGGGSYAPNIYAPSVNLSNRTPSRIMNADRIQEPNFDYLRPDFETKGSREAYKRSDI